MPVAQAASLRLYPAVLLPGIDRAMRPCRFYKVADWQSAPLVLPAARLLERNREGRQRDLRQWRGLPARDIMAVCHSCLSDAWSNPEAYAASVP